MSEALADPTLQRFDALIAQGAAIAVQSHAREYREWVSQEMNVKRWKTIDADAYHRWRTACIALLDGVLPKESVHRDTLEGFRTLGPDADHRDYLLAQLRGLRDVCAEGHLAVIAVEAKSEPIAALRQLCLRFHAVARQLRDRRADVDPPKKRASKKKVGAPGKPAKPAKLKRPTLEVNDEYDAQDLMHALLRIFFDDIRPEDPAPRRAGAPSRIDFVIGHHGIVFELKRAREGLADREIGEELIVDIERYRTHPECKRLACFVYDPEGVIGNPVELERSLSRTRDGLPVEVMVFPKL